MVDIDARIFASRQDTEQAGNTVTKPREQNARPENSGGLTWPVHCLSRHPDALGSEGLKLRQSFPIGGIQIITVGNLPFALRLKTAEPIGRRLSSIFGQQR